MGSSTTPCPSGSIQCIPELSEGSAARSSRQVLENVTLFQLMDHGYLMTIEMIWKKFSRFLYFLLQFIN